MDKKAPPRKAKKEEPKAKGISRPEIARKTREMEEGIYEKPAYEEPGLAAKYFDEDPAWLESLDQPVSGRKPAINRPKMSKKSPKRKGRRDNLPTQAVRGIRL